MIFLSIIISLIFIVYPGTTRATTSPTRIAPSLIHAKQRLDANQNCVGCSAVAGALGSGLTHALLTPLDVLKTKLQSEGKTVLGKATLITRKSTSSRLRAIIKNDGITSLFTGIKATACGYFLQGAFKFGFYEYFKEKVGVVLESNKELAVNAKIPILVGCSALAEIIASFSLCPLEATRIYMVTHPDTAIKGMIYSMRHLIQMDGIIGLYRGLPWVLLRQVPYTCVKLAGYDTISNILKNQYNLHKVRVANAATSKSTDTDTDTVNYQHRHMKLTQSEKVFFQLSGGILAGLLAAVISQPADVILSNVCSRAVGAADCVVIDSPRSLVTFLKELGVRGSFAGLKERAGMVASMTAMQFMIYENVKTKLIDVERRKSMNKRNEVIT